MTINLKVKSLLVVALTAFAVWYAYPPFDLHDAAGNVTKKGRLNLGLDLQGGMHMVLEVDTAKLTPEEAKDAPQRALEIIRNRIDQFGVLEPTINLQGTNRILVQLPGVTDRERAKEIIGKTAHLEFKLVSDDPELYKKITAGEEVEGYDLKKIKEREGKSEDILVAQDAVLTGDMLVNATTEFSQQGFGMPYVSLELNKEGGDIFADVTGKNVGKRLAVVLDGEVYTAPVIRERIPSGRAQISGNFSIEEAKDIALILRAGALPAPVKVIEERSVGAALGKDSIDKGIRSTIIGTIVVAIFMAAYYLIAGLVANFALMLNIIFITAIMSFFHSTLTLPGIAGLVLTVGMAVDANVLIFERMREESRLGKTVKAVINAGYHKAMWTILDSNITTLIAALILFQFGSGPIRGFATTLSIGIFTSMFTALMVTRIVFEYLTDAPFNMKKFPMLQIFSEKPKVPFMDIRKWAYGLSAVVLIAGMTVFVMRGEKNLGVDFTGGTLFQIEFKEKTPVNDVRKALVDAGVANATIQKIGDGKEVIIRTGIGSVDETISKLKEKLGDGSFEVMRVEEVGPAVGSELRGKAVKALLFALLGILLYVGVRFEFRYATTATIALFHDALFALGMLAISGRELSLPVVAAILTIVGYSINDTVVIFDRIREDKKLMKKASLKETIDTALNETLSRTVLTSTTVMIVVLSLFLLGGEVINDFAFVMLVGLISGTYSSIFIAAPLIIDWPSKKLGKKKR
jgi:SecD/SecF fusion protein